MRARTASRAQQVGGSRGRSHALDRATVILAVGRALDADGDEQVHTRAGGVFGDLMMKTRGVRPEFRHLAEHCQLSAARAAEIVKRGAHRNRVCVVTIVNQVHSTKQFQQLAAQRRKRHSQLAGDRSADQPRAGDGGEQISHHVRLAE